MPLASGARLGPYEVLGLIGAGGMGEVYKARDTRLDRTVAIKVLPAHVSADPERRARFEREAKTISQLNHPHICTLHDVGEHDGTAFLVMEHLDGETLAERLRRGALPLPQALDCAVQIADALAAAHKQGIIHRDLKPSNIMLLRTGGLSGPPSVKLLDFGLAKLQEPEAPAPVDGSAPTATASLTRVGEVLGTRPYMAPEQVEGKATDMRTDLWALGCVLYEMVAGRPAFSGDSAAGVTAMILDREPETLSRLQSLTPPSLERLVTRCLAKHPQDRWNSAQHVVDELRRIAREGSPTLRVGAFRSRKVLFAAVALIVTLAGAFGLLKLRPESPSVRAPASPLSVAVLPLTDRSPGKDQAAWCLGIAETLIDSLAKVRNLEVRGRQSSFQFTAESDVGDVRRKLNVDHLLTGTLQRSGGRLRISVRLINTADEVELWSETFDGDAQQIFEIQDRIASTVVGKLSASLAAGRPPTVTKRYTNNTDAYDLYLKGREIQAPSSDAALRQAIPVFLEATAKDPNFALPHVALARIYGELYVSSRLMPRDEAYKQSTAALAKALLLDRDNAEALAIRASFKFAFENDLTGAQRDFERALQLSPREPGVLEAHNLFLIQRGRLDEALDELNVLVSIDPTVPQNYFYRGRLYYYLHRYEQAIAEYDKALQLDPNHLNTWEWSILAYLAQGRKDKAVEAVTRVAPLDPPWAAGGRAWVEASSGDRLTALDFPSDVGHGQWMSAIYHAALGDRNAALANLARVARENRGTLSFCFLTHVFDKYRSDPDFVALMEKSGFELRTNQERSR